MLALTPAGGTGITSTVQPFLFDFFPNPVNDHLTVSLNFSRGQQLNVQFLTLDGKQVRDFSNQRVSAGHFLKTYSTEGLAKGIYLLKISSDEVNQCRRLFVNE